MIFKKYFSLFAILLGSISMAAAQYARLDVADPRSWGRDQGTIEDATFSLEPKGIYTEVGLFLTFSARNTRYKPGDTLEVVLNFSLPEKAIVTDSWLWIDDLIIRADILDRWTASNIYEEIVQRRRDPSILTKNGPESYELRIFPMDAGQTRKAKITYLLPAEWTADQVYNSLPMHLLQASKYPAAVRVQTRLSDEWRYPRLSGPNEVMLQPNEETGFWEARLGSNQTSSAWGLVLDAPLDQGIYLNRYAPDNVYQMVFIPERSLAIEGQASRKLLILLDHQAANTQPSNLPNLLEYIHQELRQRLSDHDQFNILWSGLQINLYDEDWLTADDATVDRVMEVFKNMDFPSYSNLPSLLGSAFQYLVKEEAHAQVLLFSSSSQEGSPAVANSLLRDLMNLRGDNRSAVHICDFQDVDVPYHYVNNVYYEGNSYFYANLSRMTGGSAVNLFCCPDLRENTQKVFREATGMKGAFDLYTTLDNGFCHSRIHLNDQQNLTDLAAPIYQIGKYEGEFPFVIEAAGVFNEQVFSNALTVEEASVFTADSIVSRTWTGNYIRELERQPQDNSTIAEIIDLSIQNRILSLYTAFLALEPGRGGEICENCRDEDGNTTDIVDLTGPDSLLQMLAFPNPFREKVTIRITAQKSVDWEAFQASIYDLSGREIARLPLPSNGRREVEVEWNSQDLDGRPVANGVYYFALQSSTNRHTLKLLKMK